MAWGLIMLYGIPNPATGKLHWGGSALTLSKLSLFGWHPFGTSTLQIYVGFVALLANLVVAVVVTVVLRALHIAEARDETTGRDYHADTDDEDLPLIAGAAAAPAAGTARGTGSDVRR
jgi:SSS family solute:Na+ symporter